MHDWGKSSEDQLLRNSCSQFRTNDFSAFLMCFRSLESLHVSHPLQNLGIYYYGTRVNYVHFLFRDIGFHFQDLKFNFVPNS